MNQEEKIKKAQRDWYEDVLKKMLDKHKERKELFTNSSGTQIERLYTPVNTTDDSYVEKLGFPGEYPFTRGVQSTMYRGRFWTMRQYSGFATARESNERYKYLLAQGQTGISIAFDLPTQIGYDSDDPISEGEVGKVGVAIDTLADMEILLDGIPLDKISTSMTINASAAVLLAMYIVVAEKQGIKPEALKGTIQNDILKEYAARGTYIFPPEQSMRLITDIFEYSSKNIPNWNTISISGYHIREAGSTAVQEVAFTLANGIAYVETALKAGLKIDDFAGRWSFFFNAHNDLFEEIAKFRAARRLWAKIIKERFEAKDERSMMLRFHTQTGGSTLTAQQPDNNIVRVAIQTLAAVLGGTQSLHTNSKDEALALPSEDSVRIALRTQQIVAHESGVCDTIDAIGGSYYVESLTDQIEDKAMEYIDKIDKLGGAVKAIEKGYMQKEIADSAYRYQKEIESGERIVVGMNKFQVEEKPVKGLLRVNKESEEMQISSLKTLKKSRNINEVEKRLQELKDAALTNKNLMPFIIDAVRVYASEGEICNVLRDVFGEYHPTEIV